MKKIKIIHTSLGVSLIEVLIAAAVMGIMALAMSHLYINGFQMFRHLEDKGSRLNLETELRFHFQMVETCENNFLNQPPSIANIQNLRNRTGSVMISTQAPQNTYDNLAITNISLNNPNGVSANQYGILQLEVLLARNDAVVTGRGFKPIQLSIPVFVNASGRISQCAPISLNGMRYIVSIGQLNQYCQGTLTGCDDINESQPRARANAFAACSRWCRQACQGAGHNCKSVNAGPVRPVINHAGGFISECSGSANIAECTCVN